MTIVTRFAPSPTGYLHVGNIRTAIANWLFARKHNGKFILRIDDTDTERSKQEYVDGIKRDLEWLGLTWDEEYYQSKRMDLYEQAKLKLIKDERLYPCFESVEELEVKKKTLLSRNLPPIYDRYALTLTQEQLNELQAKGLHPHYRFKMVDKEITWHDGIRGELKFNPKTISDPIMIRADGSMTYMIATVVDDIDLGITHIIRGEDHISNSAVHCQMFDALLGGIPNFSHLALIKAKDGEISKRIGGFDIASLRAEGYSPMSILSFLAKLGTSDPVEVCHDLKELLTEFDLAKFSKSPTNYDTADLKRLNEKLVHSLPFKDAKAFLNPEIDEAFWEGVKYNLVFSKEANDWYNIVHGEVEVDSQDTEFLKDALAVLPLEPWGKDTWTLWINAIKQSTGKAGKEIFMPIRLALTGMNHGPELKELLLMMGYDKVKQRLLPKS